MDSSTGARCLVICELSGPCRGFVLIQTALVRMSQSVSCRSHFIPAGQLRGRLRLQSAMQMQQPKLRQRSLARATIDLSKCTSLRNSCLRSPVMRSRRHIDHQPQRYHARFGLSSNARSIKASPSSKAPAISLMQTPLCRAQSHRGVPVPPRAAPAARLRCSPAHSLSSSCNKPRRDKVVMISSPRHRRNSTPYHGADGALQVG